MIAPLCIHLGILLPARGAPIRQHKQRFGQESGSYHVHEPGFTGKEPAGGREKGERHLQCRGVNGVLRGVSVTYTASEID